MMGYSRWRAEGGAGALLDDPPHHGLPEVIVSDMLKCQAPSQVVEKMVTIEICVANYTRRNCEGKITNVFTDSSPGGPCTVCGYILKLPRNVYVSILLLN